MRFRFLSFPFLSTVLATGLVISGRASGAPASLVIDDFEDGVSNWTRADKANVGLSDILAVNANTASGSSPTSGAASKSSGVALMTFKSAQKTWASLSRDVDGAAWAKIGASALTFRMSGDDNARRTVGVRGVTLQLRAKTAGRDMTFSLPGPVRLDIPRWRRVAVPLLDFKGPKGELLAPRLSAVYLLQFQQTGTWDSRFFSIDDIAVEGSGIPIIAAAPKKPAPVSTRVSTQISAPLPNTGAIKIGADFLRVSGSIRASANISLGQSLAGPGALPLETSKEFRNAVALLKPKFVRLDAGALADLADSSRPAFDFSRLIDAARRARALGAEPLVALTNPPEWGLDARSYGVLCTDTARALNAKGSGASTRFFELSPGGEDIDDATAIAYYNTGYGALKGLSKTLRVGGFGAPAGALATQTAFLQSAKGLDFLSVSAFGAQSGTPSDALLLSGARDVAALKTAAGALDKSKYPRAALFVTQANLSGAKNPGENTPSDIRLVGRASGAWWALFMASGSRLADQVFHNDAINPEWGFLDEGGRAYPSYYSLWLWNTFFPAGSKRVVTTSSNPAVFVGGANTPTSHNLLLVNTTNAPQIAQIGIRGFPVLREARLRLFDDPQQSVRFTTLPKSPFQTVKLEAYAVAVVQFIEPPKR